MKATHFVLPTIGSAGDVNPLLGLGRALKQRGHRVTIVTNPYFQEDIQRAGLGFAPIGTVEEFRAGLENPDLWHPTRAFETIARMALLPATRELYAMLAQCDPAETLVGAPSLCFGARLAQEKLGLRLATIHLQPSLLRSAYQAPVLGEMAMPDRWPPAIKRLIFNLMDALLIDRVLAPKLNAFRAELGLAPVHHILGDWMHSPELVLGLFPEWLAPCQPDWPPNVRLTGFVYYDAAHGVETIPPAVARFLEAGDPPIVFTPGTANQHGQAFFAASVAASQALGLRALLLTRHLGQLPASLPATVHAAEYVPFSQVLPRAAAIVHHGGIGTLAQALAAGLPQLVMPLSHDQPDNAARLQRLGVGTWLRPAQYKAPAVSSKLDGLLNSTQVAARCRELAQKLAGQDAVTVTCDSLEQMAGRG